MNTNTCYNCEGKNGGVCEGEYQLCDVCEHACGHQIGEWVCDLRDEVAELKKEIAELEKARKGKMWCDNGKCIGGRSWTTDESSAIDDAKMFCSGECADEWVKKNIVFNCEECDKAIIRNSDEHDHCDCGDTAEQDDEKWWCQDCLGAVLRNCDQCEQLKKSCEMGEKHGEQGQWGSVCDDCWIVAPEE